MAGRRPSVPENRSLTHQVVVTVGGVIAKQLSTVVDNPIAVPVQRKPRIVGVAPGP
jgi:hypothetical protein